MNTALGRSLGGCHSDTGRDGAETWLPDLSANTHYMITVTFRNNNLVYNA